MGRGGTTALITCAAGLLLAQSAGAATIDVTTTSDEYGTGTACALREAARAAYTDATYGGCTAGSATGEDFIRLRSGRTYRLTRPRSGADTEGTGDVDLFAPVMIAPGGSGLATIDASGANERAFEFATSQGSDVQRLRIQGGDTPEAGGALKASGTLRVNDSVLTQNRTSGGSGGAIASFTNLILTNTTISGNTAAGHGGGIIHLGALLVLQETTVSQNKATGAFGGGGVALDGAGVGAVFTNTTISGNTAAQNGGAIQHITGGTLSLENVTIAGNSAGASGGGVYEAGGDLFSHNTILAGNSAGADNSEDCKGTLNGSRNLIQVLSGCVYFPASNSDVVGQPAQLGPLTDNGGPVKTRALLPGSPAIDAGNPGSGSNQCSEHDARAVPRSLGGRCDMGAYELVRCADQIVNRVGTFAATETVLGTAGADGFLLFDGRDVAKGKGGADRICGGPGNDKLIGGGGRDLLFGEAGKDRLLGGAGRDRLVGGPGRDRCLGGPARDRAKSCSRRIGIP